MEGGIIESFLWLALKWDAIENKMATNDILEFTREEERSSQ